MSRSYVCDDCGEEFDRPDERLLYRESWGYHGGSPAEYAYQCPGCGSEDFEERRSA